MDEEKESDTLARFSGIDIPVGKVLSLERRGWRRGSPQDAGIQCWIWRSLPDGRAITAGLNPGIAVGYVNELGEVQRFEEIYISQSSDGGWYSPHAAIPVLDARRRLRVRDPARPHRDGGAVTNPTPPPTPTVTAAEKRMQRPSAEVRYADELARLRASDDAARPPGWALSLRAARRFIIGDESAGITRKFVGDPSLIDRALVSLATSRGLMLVGEPGTAKSLLSELLAAAVSGDSTLTIQGGAATTEDQIKYSWNYALLVAEGPSTRSLVAAPLLRGMAEGRVVRFEEITRCPLEVQDCLLSPLSDRVLTVPELTGEDALVFAREGSTSSRRPTPATAASTR